MSENLKTIKELADELGTNKSKIFRIIKNRSIKTYHERNKIVLDEQAIKTIKEEFRQEKRVTKNKPERTCDTINDTIFDTVLVLKNELKIAHEQNKQLLEAQKQTQNLLDQQQRLALQDKKLLEEYKAEINDLKALKMPSEDTKEEQSSNRSLEKEKDFVQTIQESYESEIKVLNQKIAEQEEQLQEIQKEKEKETKEKKWFQFWK